MNTTYLAPKDRIRPHIEEYLNTELDFALRNPLAASDHGRLLDKSDYYAHLDSYFSAKQLSADEKRVIKFIRHERAVIEQALRPAKTKIGKIIRRAFLVVKERLAGDYDKMKDTLFWYNNLRRDNIIDFNTKELVKDIKDKGFTGDNLEVAIRNRLELGQQKFDIPYFDTNTPDADYTLCFEKIPYTQIYQFTSFEAITRPKKKELAGYTDTILKQTFKAEEITLKQAADLINKRPVFLKDKQWLVFDPRLLGTAFPFSTKLFDTLKAIEELPLTINDRLARQLAKKIESGQKAVLPAQYGEYEGAILAPNVHNQKMLIKQNDAVVDVTESSQKRQAHLRAVYNEATQTKKSKSKIRPVAQS